MKHSEQIDQIAAALCKAQGQMRGALKDSNNPYFKSKYADLASVVDAYREPFAGNGLALIQSAHGDAVSVTVVTMLLHNSGQWFRDELQLTPKDMSPQSIGSAITYGRRYGAQAMAGIAPEDDDGNAASGRDNGKSERTITSSQVESLAAMIEKTGTNLQSVLGTYKIKSLPEMPEASFQHAMAILKNKPAKENGVGHATN